jgi:hypothetical protein
MQQEINIPNFTIEEKGSFLHAKVSYPVFNLIGARLFVPGYLGIEACVVELFSIIDVEHALVREANIDFEVGDWYLKIKIFEGWHQFKELNLSTLYLIESQPQKLNFDETKIPENSILFKLKNMSLKDFDNYYIDLRGGETGGAGRNEHGEQHFHIIRKSDKKDLGKVFFPSVEDYQNNQTCLDFPDIVNSKIRKDIIEWIFAKNQENLIKLNSAWSTQNQFNNRIRE